MCRGTDHAIVKRKSQSLFRGKMRINDLGIGGICLAKRSKQPLGLRGKVVACTDRDQTADEECLDLLVKAKYAAFLGSLLGLQERKHVRVTTVQQH